MSNVPENLNAVPTDASISPNITPEDQDCVKMVMKLFHKYKKHREKYDRNWLHYYKIFRGDQWDGIKMPRYRQKEVVNMVWDVIQGNVPLQTDVRPQMSFIAEEPSDTEFAGILNEISNSDWDRNNWLVPLTEIILDGYLYGTGYGEIGYDPDADYGLGSALFESTDPFYVYPDPEARQINEKRSQGLITAEPVDTERLKKQYPEWAHLLKADVQDVIASSKTALNDFKFRAASTDRDMPDVTFLEGKESAEQRTLLITAYLKPDETEEITEPDGVNDLGEPQVKVIVKKRYPLGRKVVVACGVKLEDGPLPFEHGMLPFCKYNNYLLSREFYGVSEVEQLESPQRVFNKILNAQLEIMNLMGNPVWIIDHTSGIDPNMLVNRTGLVVEKEPGSEVRREVGVQLSPAALQLIDRMQQWFNNVAGTQDVSRGEAPAGVTAASAIEALQQAARTRIRQKQRNLDAFIRDMGQQYIGVILEKYTASRVFRVTNQQGASKYFRMSVEKVQDDMGKMKTKALLREFVQNPDGQIVPSNEIKEFFINGRFDVRVNTSSALPFAVADKEQKTLQLFDRGIIDEEEVLANIDYPNREAVLARLNERKAMQAEAQQKGT
jgi:hypothetical protein